MDKKKKEALESFANLVRSSSDDTLKGGRPASAAGKEKIILEDIVSKVKIEKGMAVFDVGCGYSSFTKEVVRYFTHNEINLTLMDSQEVLTAVEDWKEQTDSDGKVIQYVPGSFPDDLSADFLSHERFDIILLYSVLHYSDRPRDMVSAAVKLLEPGGRVLCGDLPNVNKKGRFLATDRGRAFDADYKGVLIEEIPKYANHSDFIRANRETINEAISDDFVLQVMKAYREQGFDVYLLPQPEGLPFSYTREDLVIWKND